MILFKPEHVPLILNDIKTQTRRLWKKQRAKVGSTHQAKTTLYGVPFTHLKIIKSYPERLGDISQKDIIKEGYITFEDYKEIWIKLTGDWDPDLIPYVIEFKRDLEILYNKVGI